MKQVTDYEVEGSWNAENKPSLCRFCGSKLEIVPKEGHYNSQFWRLKRNDGCLLFCCPNGCSEKGATEKTIKYLSLKDYLTDDSEPHKFFLDYKKIINCWIEPNGVVHPVEPTCHINFANSIDKSEKELELLGWTKISRTATWTATCFVKRFTKKQKDAIFDFCVAHNFLTDELFSDSCDNHYIVFKTNKEE